MESILNYEGDIVYKTSGNESLSGLAVSPGGNKLGFFSENFSTMMDLHVKQQLKYYHQTSTILLRQLQATTSLRLLFLSPRR